MKFARFKVEGSDIYKGVITEDTVKEMNLPRLKSRVFLA